MHPKPTGISVTPSMCMLPCGITGVATLFRKASLTPIRLKATTLNSGIIWLVWLVLPDVFHVARMLCIVRFVCLSIISISANWESNCSQQYTFHSIDFVYPLLSPLPMFGGCFVTARIVYFSIFLSWYWQRINVIQHFAIWVEGDLDERKTSTIQKRFGSILPLKKEIIRFRTNIQRQCVQIGPWRN